MPKTPTRFPNGVTNRGPADQFAKLLLPDPTAMATYFNDFFTYDASDWTITTVELGAGSASEAIADEDGGVLLITNAAGDNDADFFQSTGESWTFEGGKRLFFKARFKVSDATQSDIVFGLQVRDTTPLMVSDGVFFQKDDGDANLDVHVKATADTAEAAVATLADDTYVEVAFFYNGDDEVVFFVNGAAVVSLATTNLPSTELTLSFGVQNGAAAVKTMSVDYVFVAKER